LRGRTDIEARDHFTKNTSGIWNYRAELNPIPTRLQVCVVVYFSLLPSREKT